MSSLPSPSSLRSFVLGAVVAGACFAAGYSLHQPDPIVFKSPTRAASDLTPMAGVASAAAPFEASASPRVHAEENEEAPPSDEDRTSVRAITERALDFSVSVRVGRAYGAGALIAPGVIVTASHVVAEEPDEHVQVRFRDSDWLAATVLTRESAVDLALLRVDSGERAPAELASALALGPPDALVSVGSPRELGFTVHQGNVSFVGRRFGAVRYVQTDLPANPGSSGGPVVDERGRLVGVMAFVLRDSEGIAFVTPIDYVRSLLSEATVEGVSIVGPDGAEGGAEGGAFEIWRDADAR